MAEVNREHRWLAVLADASAATLFGVEGVPRSRSTEPACDDVGGAGRRRPVASTTHLVAHRYVQYELDALCAARSLPELSEFVGQHRLAGCPARLYFAGAGTVAHALRMPRIGPRRRAKAIRTRLAAYAGGRELCLDHRTTRTGPDGNIYALAAGTDAALVRAWQAALRRARLRVGTTTALVAGFSAPAPQGRAVQVVIGERTTAIQLFSDGCLVFCRDILLGRTDFVAAYRRPILSDDGPVTLTPEQAEKLTSTVGVPTGGSEPVPEGVRSDRLWPLITPVLQKLRSEVQQTVTEHWGPNDSGVSLSVLSLPCIRGLAEFLAARMNSAQVLVSDQHVETVYLTTLWGAARQSVPLDLSPPEERFVQRLVRPAIAAGLCAFLVMFSNATTPRVAYAELARLKPVSAALDSRRQAVQTELAAARAAYERLLSEFRARSRMAAAMPPCVPVIDVCQALFETVPPDVELLEVNLRTESARTELEILASYHGVLAGGVVAAEWARCLEAEPRFSDAKVMAVDGDGLGGRATLALRVSLRCSGRSPCLSPRKRGPAVRM